MKAVHAKIAIVAIITFCLTLIGLEAGTNYIKESLCAEILICEE